LTGCGRCGGDLLQDNDEWRCFQCGNVYYPEHSQLPLERAVAAQVNFAYNEDKGLLRPKVRRSARHLSPDTTLTHFNEEQWWDRNQQVIQHLDQEMKVREIAEIVGRGPRQIRVVREKLRDLRTANLEFASVS